MGFVEFPSSDFATRACLFLNGIVLFRRTVHVEPFLLRVHPASPPPPRRGIPKSLNRAPINLQNAQNKKGKVRVSRVMGPWSHWRPTARLSD